MALGMLSSEDTRGYFKALHILDNFVKVGSCLLMLDLECDELIADMFKQFLSTIRYTPLHVVFRQMENIMTLTIKESEEISDELLSILLAGVSKKKENVMSRSWRLGEKVLRNCAVELQHFLPKVVRSRDLSFDDYPNIVASICQNSPEDEHVVKQQGNTEAGRHLQPTNSDVTGTMQVKAVTVPKKRGRKPSSLQKPEEGCRDLMTGVKRESLEEPCCRKIYNKNIGSSASEQSALRQEERVTNSCII